jgi:ABC-type Mn2+/Zn2+ transport system permease subunit
MLVWSTTIGAVAGVVGMYVSYYWNPPPGAAIVLILAAVFALVYLGTAITGRRRLRVLDTEANTDVAGPALLEH